MTALLCPVCSQSHFSTLEALRSRLVRAATQNITCPVCGDQLLGLDKFTIHLFGHSLSPPESPRTSPIISTVNLDDLSNLTSWHNGKGAIDSHRIKLDCCPQNKFCSEVNNNAASRNVSLQIKESSTGNFFAQAHQDGNREIRTGMEEIQKQRINNYQLENTEKAHDMSSDQSQGTGSLFFLHNQNVEKFINPHLIQKPNKRQEMPYTIDMIDGRHTSPKSDSPPSFLFDGDTGFLLNLSPAKSHEDDSVKRPSGEELSQYMSGLLRLDVSQQSPEDTKSSSTLDIFGNRSMQLQTEGKIDGIAFTRYSFNEFHNENKHLDETEIKLEQGQVRPSCQQSESEVMRCQQVGQSAFESSHLANQQPTTLTTIGPHGEECKYLRSIRIRNDRRSKKAIERYENIQTYERNTDLMNPMTETLSHQADARDLKIRKDTQESHQRMGERVIEIRMKDEKELHQRMQIDEAMGEMTKDSSELQQMIQMQEVVAALVKNSQDLQQRIHAEDGTGEMVKGSQVEKGSAGEVAAMSVDRELHVCRECGKGFRIRGSLVVHTRVAHDGRGLQLSQEPRNYHCTLCSKSFKKEQHLGQHMKTHDGKQWQCETCAKFFTTKYFLKKHQRLHTGEMPYCCEACGKAFTFQQSYHKHLLYHSSDKPHECRECGRAFKELSTLHNHERIHSGEKPFACETCGKCFRQRVSYIVHRRIHTGVLPYQCTACFKKFRYKMSKRNHKCTAQPPGEVVRQPGDLIQRLLQQRNMLPCQQPATSEIARSQPALINTIPTMHIQR